MLPRRCVLPEARVSRAAVFLDRDGTISEEVGYLNHVSRFRIFPFAPGAIRLLNSAKLAVIVVTNQSGLARGYFPESLVRTVHELMTEQLAAAGAHLDAIYYCPHASGDGCGCRKPRIGLLERASQEHGLDLRRSFVVGDRYDDIELAHRAGCRGVLLRTGYGEGELAWHAATWPAAPDFVARDLAEGAEWIVGQTR